MRFVRHRMGCTVLIKRVNGMRVRLTVRGRYRSVEDAQRAVANGAHFYVTQLRK